MKACSLAVLIALSSVTQAQLPTGASVVSGKVTFGQGSNALTVTQASQAAIVNWQSFDIGVGNQVNIVQPNAAAAMLARVTSSSPTSLQGMLQANGQLFLINQSGIIIGKNAVINTAGFVASTLDVNNASFLAGAALNFSGDGSAGIVNLGSITATEGNVYLFAHTVSNSGSISASNGSAGLAAATQVELASPDAPGFTVGLNLPSTTATTGISNSGVISAAQAQLEAAGGSIYELAVNQSGAIRATGTARLNGRVLLTADGGEVGVSGTVSAENADGSGGEILVGGDHQGTNPLVPDASYTVVTPTGNLNASAVSATGNGGDVIVWSNEGTRFLGNLTATGEIGGFAEISSKQYLDFSPASPVQLGSTGSLLLDPDALIISTDADSGTTTASGNPYVFGAATTPANLNVATLENQLAVSNVTLDTSTSGGDITVNAPITWATNNTLRLQAGGSINLNANITGGSTSTLALYAGPFSINNNADGGALNPGATLDSSATITVGTLIYGVNAAAVVPGQTVSTPVGNNNLELDGNVNVKTLEVDLSGGSTAVTTFGTNNTIGAFTTVGSAELGECYVENDHGSMTVTFSSTIAQGPYEQFISAGDLTLASGSSFNFDPSSPGTVVLGSSGGGFINQAGGSVFGNNVSYQIYTSSPGATTLGGLSGTTLYSHPYNADDNYTGNYVFYSSSNTVSTPILTFAAEDLTKVYGAANPTLAYSTSGWLQGVTNDVTGSPMLSVAATQSSGVGSYAIAISNGTLASSNYDFSFVNGTLTVTPAPLLITANSSSRTFGTANPVFSYTATGWVNGDTASVLSGSPSLTTNATVSSNVGGYLISAAAGSLSASNYTFEFAPGTLTVGQALLTFAANNLSRTYGAANPMLTYAISGLQQGVVDDVTGSPSLSVNATSSSGVGSFTISIGNGTLASSNYTFAFIPGLLSITPAPLVVAVTGASRSYGQANPTFGAAISGLVNGDTSSVITGYSLSTAATATSLPGAYPIIGSGTAANYAITFVPGVLAVSPNTVLITVPNATATTGQVPASFAAQYSVNSSIPVDFTVSGVSSATSSSAPGTYVITPKITADGGLFDSLFDVEYTFVTAQTGTLTLSAPKEVTNSISLQPSTLLQSTKPTSIYANDTTTNSAVTVNKTSTVTVTTNNSALTSGAPALNAQQYANFLGEFDGDQVTLVNKLQSSYTTLLQNATVSGSAYQQMTVAERSLLAQFMSGVVTVQYLQYEVSIGNTTALEVLSFILPTLINMTLDKPASELTFDDNTLLSRLGTLTAQHMSSVISIAEYDYQQMLGNNAKTAESSGLEQLFAGGGDFSNIVQQANQQALGEYLGAAIGAGAGTFGTAATLCAIPAVVNAVFPATGVYTAMSSASGPAIAVVNMAVLAIRAVQISQSTQNQNAYNQLMANWPPGSTINSVSQLNGSGMSQNLQIGTLMLSTEILSLSSSS